MTYQEKILRRDYGLSDDFIRALNEFPTLYDILWERNDPNENSIRDLIKNKDSIQVSIASVDEDCDIYNHVGYKYRPEKEFEYRMTMSADHRPPVIQPDEYYRPKKIPELFTCPDDFPIPYRVHSISVYLSMRGYDADSGVLKEWVNANDHTKLCNTILLHLTQDAYYSDSVLRLVAQILAYEIYYHKIHEGVVCTIASNEEDIPQLREHLQRLRIFQEYPVDNTHSYFYLFYNLYRCGVLPDIDPKTFTLGNKDYAFDGINNLTIRKIHSDYQTTDPECIDQNISIWIDAACSLYDVPKKASLVNVMLHRFHDIIFDEILDDINNVALVTQDLIKEQSKNDR